MHFITAEESMGKYIDIASRYLFHYILREMEPYQLQKHQFKILVELYHEEGICQEDLVERLKLRKPDVAKAIKKMMELGYVYKERDEKDKRIHHLYITEKGQSIRKDIVSVLEESSKILTQNIEPEELEIAKRVMEQMASNMYQAIKKE